MRYDQLKNINPELGEGEIENLVNISTGGRLSISCHGPGALFVHFIAQVPSFSRTPIDGFVLKPGESREFAAIPKSQTYQARLETDGRTTYTYSVVDGDR